ncbi:MAG: xylulokinase [Rhodobacteraceae bacterium]|nr:xylulokinase [Paracoccaceae bacterium]
MYLGIDLGTSAVKALLIDDAQKLIASATAPLEVSRPHRGWSEQDPADWVTATGAALDQLKAESPAALVAVRGIGLSGQMHGATLVDAEDQALRPCILWNDSRSAEQAARLDADPKFRAISGNIVFPGFTAPKLTWVKENEPALFARLSKVLLPKDYLRLWLTGEKVADMCDSSGTGWLDNGARRWSSELVETSGVSLDHMPPLVESTEPTGMMRAALAARWGMRADVIVAGGAGDSATSALGVGAVAADTGFVSLGTSGVLLVANKGYQPAPDTAVHTFCHAIPERWHQIGAMLSSASALNWFAGVAGRSPGELVAEVGEGLREPGAVMFLPYLSGERTPHNDTEVRGMFAGLGHDTDRAAMTRAVMEGVGFAFRDNWDVMRDAGAGLTRVTAVGGGSRSRYWLEVLATVMGMPVDIPADGEVGAAFGAARLGMVVSARADPMAVCAPPAIQAVIEPRGDARGAFEEAYQRFRELYPLARQVKAPAKAAMGLHEP